MKEKGQNIVELIVHAIRRIYDRNEGVIPLHAPCFKGNEWRYVRECIDTGWVSSVGAYVEKFEDMIARYTGAKYAIATVNGTTALHIGLILSGVETEDEVLCPSFTFVATVSTILYCKAVPVFIDSDLKTLGLDISKIKKFLAEKCFKKEDGFTYNGVSKRRIKACIPMHAYGFPVNMEPLLRLCEEYNINVIEDSAEALGSFYQGKHCGTISTIGILSFNGNKIITTGGGGMILVNAKEIAEMARHLTTTAKVNHPWEYIHDQLGYNYRMPNINAALGCAQLENLPEFLKKKKSQSDSFNDFMKGEEEIRNISPEFGEWNHWLNLIKIKKECKEGVLTGLRKRGIEARASWFPIHKMEPYHHFEKFEIHNTEELSSCLICLPNGILKF